MKTGTLFKKAAFLMAAGLLSVSCIQPMMLWAEEKANTAQDEEIDYPDHIFDIYIYYVTDENEYEIVEYTFYDPQEYVTMKDLGISLPEYTSPAPGVIQTGWKDSMGNPITEDTVFHTHDDYAAGIIQMIYADYDKAVSVGHISYINSEGIVIEDTAVGFFDVCFFTCEVWDSCGIMASFCFCSKAHTLQIQGPRHFFPRVFAIIFECFTRIYIRMRPRRRLR